jgi:hypothetical protein
VVTVTETRCPAAHPDDPTPCVGPIVVTVLDALHAGSNGCEWHAARLLASVAGARVYGLPSAPEGAAIRVFKAAAGLRPFPWLENPTKAALSLRSIVDNLRGGEQS